MSIEAHQKITIISSAISRFKHPIQKLQNISTKQPQDLEIQAGAYKSLKVQQMHNIGDLHSILTQQQHHT